MNSNYDALSGGVSAWGLGGMGAVRRGGFGSGGALGTPPFPYPLPAGYTLDSNGYLVLTSDGSLWVFDLDNDGAFGLDPTTNSYLIEAA